MNTGGRDLNDNQRSACVSRSLKPLNSPGVLLIIYDVSQVPSKSFDLISVGIINYDNKKPPIRFLLEDSKERYSDGVAIKQS